MKIKEDYICPKCQHKNRIKLFSEVTGDNISKIIDKSIFVHTCKNCGERISVEYPLTVVKENYKIHFTPNDNSDLPMCDAPINRVCDTYADLKEKILILEDNLDDIVIEELKTQIKKNLGDLDIKDLGSLETIRYNSKDNINLNFSLVGIGKLVGVSIGEYQNLKNSIKKKRINKSVLIDEYTYKKYIRRCSYEIASKKRFRFFKW